MPQPVVPDPSTLALAQHIAESFIALPEVAAVALAGSQTAGTSDAQSDLDIYVFTQGDIGLDLRAQVANRHGAQDGEIGNDDFGPGDEWADGATGRGIDLMYFGVVWVEAYLERILVQHQAALGYTTAIWSTLQRAVPLFDRDGWFASVQTRAAQPYPEPLRHAIIAKNHRLLRLKRSSYFTQLIRAVARQDRLSLNHRLTALLASYFDILFALNRIPHPGEKRQLHYARTWCPLRPPAMDAQIDAVIAALATSWDDDAFLDALTALLDDLDRLLHAEGLL